MTNTPTTQQQTPMTPVQPPITHGHKQLPPEQRITYETAEHLAQVIHLNRPTWNIKSIVTILEPLAPYIPKHDLTAALALLARNPKAETPKLLHHPGPHWDTLKPETKGPSDPTGRPSPPCPIPEHAKIGKLATNCPECRKFQNFPPQIPKPIYDQLHPDVQHLINQHPTTVVLG